MVTIQLLEIISTAAWQAELRSAGRERRMP